MLHLNVFNLKERCFIGLSVFFGASQGFLIALFELFTGRENELLYQTCGVGPSREIWRMNTELLELSCIYFYDYFTMGQAPVAVLIDFPMAL